MNSFRIVAVVALLAACAPGIHPTVHLNIYGSEATISGNACARGTLEAEAAKVAVATIAELRKRGLLQTTPNIAVCAIDRLPPIACGVLPYVYGCALPYKNALLTVAAARDSMVSKAAPPKGQLREIRALVSPLPDGWTAVYWRGVMAGEVVKVLGDTGRLTLPPGECEKCKHCRPNGAACFIPEGIGAQVGVVDFSWYGEVIAPFVAGAR